MMRFLAILFIVLVAAAAQAATSTWDGDTDDLWTTSANWDAAPVSGNTADIVFSGPGAANPVNYVGTDTTIRSMTINDNTGATLGKITTQVSSTDPTAANLTFQADSGNATITRTSGSTANNYRIGNGGAGEVVLASDLDIDNAGGSLLIDTVVSETGGSRQITKTGSGTLTMAGAHTYSGGLRVQEGIVLLNNADAGGTGTTTLGSTGGTADARIQFNTSLNYNSDIVVASQASGTLMLRKGTGVAQANQWGTVTLDGDLTTEVVASLMRFNDTISGVGGVTLTRGQINYANAAMTYTGDTTIGDGSFSSRLRIQSGSYDGGGDVVVNANGIFEFLNGAQVTLNIAGNGVNNSISGAGNLEAEGNFFFDLSGADATPGNSWDIVTSAGTKLYAGTFLVNSSLGTFAESSDVWTLSDSGKTWTYEEGTGVLSVIPEPATLGTFLLGGLVFLVSRRSRRS